jgi:DNA-binding transcriptional LysR family regulator
MASAADALVRAASAQGHEVAGAIRLTASDVIGAEVLPAILAEFWDAYPKVSIELGLANQTVDLIRRDADIAVRMVEPSQKALIARKVGAVPMALHAKQSYLDKHGTPKDLDDLRRHALIGFDAELPPSRIMKSLPLKITRDFFTLRCDNDLGQLAALRAGFGIGSLQYGIARRDPQLVPVLADQLSFDLELWVVMHENLKKVKRMHLMFDHLVSGLSRFVEYSNQR